MADYSVMRIITRLIIGGPTLHTVLLTNSFDKENDFTSMLVCGKGSPGEKEMYYLADQYGVKPYYIEELGREINLVREIKSIYKVYKLIKKTRPTIIHTHTAKAGLIGRLAAWITGVPVIAHTYHGNFYRHYFGPLKTSFFLLIERLLAHISDVIIAISPRQADELKSLRLGTNKITVIPLGFDFTRIVNGEKGHFRDKINISDQVKLVGIVGRLVPIKNHRLFIKTAKEVVENGCFNDTCFVIIGDGEIKYRKSLEKMVEDLGLRDRVYFVGWQKDMAAVYQDLDVSVLTSLNEGTPVTLIEAMAAGCPVVSTEVGGVADVVKHGKSGLLAQSGDAKTLAEHIIKLLKDDNFKQEIIKNAQERVMASYSIERLHEDLKKLYLGILDEKS